MIKWSNKKYEFEGTIVDTTEDGSMYFVRVERCTSKDTKIQSWRNDWIVMVPC